MFNNKRFIVVATNLHFLKFPPVRKFVVHLHLFVLTLFRGNSIPFFLMTFLKFAWSLIKALVPVSNVCFKKTTLVI